MDVFLTLESREILARILIVILALLLLLLAVRVTTRILTIPLRRLMTRAGYPNVDHVIGDLVRLPTRLLMGAVMLAIVVIVLELDPAFEETLQHIAASLVIAALVVVVARLLGYLFSSAQLRAAIGLNVDSQLLPFLKTGLEISVVVIGVVFALQAWGIDVGALIAGLGIAGLAVSLAAQDTIANIFGFFVIVADRPFTVGEWIVMPDCEGKVEEVRLRSTRVRQMDQSLVIVPNSKMASASVVNWSRLGKRMVNVNFGLPSTTPPDVLASLLERLRGVLRGYPSVEQSTLQAYFINIGAQSLEVLVRAYVMIPDALAFRAEQERILLALKREVDAMQLQIASPTTLVLKSFDDLLPGVPRADKDAPPAATADEGDSR